jgi:hypothetical protein
MITCSISEDHFCVIDERDGVKISMVGWHKEENSFYVSVMPCDVKESRLKLISKDEAMRTMKEWTAVALDQALNKGVSNA